MKAILAKSAMQVADREQLTSSTSPYLSGLWHGTDRKTSRYCMPPTCGGYTMDMPAGLLVDTQH